MKDPYDHGHEDTYDLEEMPRPARATSNPGGPTVFWERFKKWRRGQRDGHCDDSEFRDEFGNWISGHLKSARELMDPAKQAERKEITDARVEGYLKGQVHGYRRGITQGIAAMVLLIILINTIERIAG